MESGLCELEFDMFKKLPLDSLLVLFIDSDWLVTGVAGLGRPFSVNEVEFSETSGADVVLVKCSLLEALVAIGVSHMTWSFSGVVASHKKEYPFVKLLIYKGITSQMVYLWME